MLRHMGSSRLLLDVIKSGVFSLSWMYSIVCCIKGVSGLECQTGGWWVGPVIRPEKKKWLHLKRVWGGPKEVHTTQWARRSRIDQHKALKQLDYSLFYQKEDDIDDQEVTAKNHQPKLTNVLVLFRMHIAQIGGKKLGLRGCLSSTERLGRKISMMMMTLLPYIDLCLIT